MMDAKHTSMVYKAFKEKGPLTEQLAYLAVVETVKSPPLVEVGDS